MGGPYAKKVGSVEFAFVSFFFMKLHARCHTNNEVAVRQSIHLHVATWLFGVLWADESTENLDRPRPFFLIFQRFGFRI